MLMRAIVQLRPALEAVKDCTREFTDPELQELIPHPEDFQLIESIIPVLSKFEAVLDFMRGEKTPTICYVMLKIWYLQTQLSATIKKSQVVEVESLR